MVGVSLNHRQVRGSIATVHKGRNRDAHERISLDAHGRQVEALTSCAKPRPSEKRVYRRMSDGRFAMHGALLREQVAPLKALLMGTPARELKVVEGVRRSGDVVEFVVEQVGVGVGRDGDGSCPMAF